MTVRPADRRLTPSRRIVHGTAVYTAGAILQRAVNFLLLPLFTAFLSPGEFGQIGVITAIAAALSVVATFGLETAVFRGYSRAMEGSEGTAPFVNALGVFSLAVPTALALIFASVGAPLLAEVFEVPADALRLAGIGAAATAAATLLPMAVLRAQERLGAYLQLTGLQVAVTPTLTVLFVAILDQGVVGWMLAYAISSAVLLIRGLILLHHKWSLEFNVSHLRTALAFGIPLIPHGISHWGLSVSDRAILGAFVAAPEVGTYFLAYLLCLPISLVAIALSQATQPLFMEAIVSRSSYERLERVVSAQTVAIVLGTSAVALIGPPAAHLLFSEEYSDAARLIPWLAVGTGLFGLYLMPMNSISLMAGETRFVWVITAVAAATNIGLNILLVPRFGTTVAAVNTAIGYGLLVFGVFTLMRRVCDPPLPMDLNRIGLGVLVIATASVIAALLTGSDSVSGLAIRMALLTIAAALLALGPFRRETVAAARALRPHRATTP